MFREAVFAEGKANEKIKGKTMNMTIDVYKCIDSSFSCLKMCM